MLISFLIVLLIIFTASVPAAAQYGDSGSFQTSEGCICGVIIFVIIIAVILIYYPMKKDQDAKKAREYYYPGTAPRAVETSKPWWLMSSSEYQNYIRQQRKQLHGNNQKPPWLGQSGSKPIDLDAYDELADEPETEVETETEAPAMVVQEMKGEQRSARKKKKLSRREGAEDAKDVEDAGGSVILVPPKKRMVLSSGPLIAGIPEPDLIAIRIKNEELNTALYDLETKKAMGKISKDEFEIQREIVIKKHLEG